MSQFTMVLLPLPDGAETITSLPRPLREEGSPDLFCILFIIFVFAIVIKNSPLPLEGLGEASKDI